MHPTQAIHDLVRSGRITAEHGAMLLEVRRRLVWKRKPWWEKALIVLGRALVP